MLLVTTAGFEDVADFGEQVRPELFELAVRRAAPLGIEVLGVPGRIGADGDVVACHRLDSLDAGVRAALAGGIEDAAVVLVHGPRSPAEVQRVADHLRRLGVPRVVAGVSVAPAADFLRRLHTTIADASLSPLLPRAPGGWMCSDGGLAPHDADEWRGSRAVLSGPAGGVVATGMLARRSCGGRSVIGLDMGGTSTDVCRIDGAVGVRTVDHITVGDLTLATPAVRLETIAAGGGSCLGMQGGVFTVGPRSAGSDPGPACYGRGGPLALTDVEAVLGRLPTFPSVAGPQRDEPLALESARGALRAMVTGELEVAAAGFREVAHEKLAQAVRRVCAVDAADPAEHVLVAFGGAGPAHACGVARALGILEVRVPLLAGVFSAVGIGAARRRVEHTAPIVGQGEAAALLRAAWEAMRAGLPPGKEQVFLLARHVGTAGVLELPLAVPAAAKDLVLLQSAAGVSVLRLTGALLNDFHALHRRHFGFERPELPVEAVAVKGVWLEAPRPVPELAVDAPAVPAPSCRAWFDGEWREVPVFGVGSSDEPVCWEGPCILVLPGATAVVEPGWQAHLEDDHVVLRDQQSTLPSLGAAAHPTHTAVFAARLGGIAEAMGETLARLARSVSIRDRRDFSCAIFDAHGCLVVNAPHVPVHLGAMGQTVRALIAARGDALRPGQCWVTNDPYDGGSHLPDITVIEPIFDVHSDAVQAFVACRGHHVDVGGSRPGSMPPDAVHIREEGVVIPHSLLRGEDGRLRVPELGDCRQPAEVIADLAAQAAACAEGGRGMVRLLDVLGPAVVRAQLAHVQSTAARAVAEVLAERVGVWTGEETFDDGTHLRVRLEVSKDHTRVVIDAPAHPGNLNAPTAVARAATLYVLRCLVGLPIPLNEGVLDSVEVSVEPGGLFDPSWPRAVAGGNVETSQRLVDALLQALQVSAAGQGTMNNLTIGTPAGAWYETIAGGTGATADAPGATAVQVHMTNTRATDVERLEARFPVRLERFAVRRGSGGRGRHDGGDGVIKVWRFLAPAEVAMLAGRRDKGAPGLAGGRPGAPGRDLRDRGAGWEPAPRAWSARPGDRLRVETPGGGGWGEPI
ncbi:MAG: 5-oxoprolinase [Phycisphaerae bacterium]|nr:5-oxoprolinase [Phycisphaerae bacterium]